MEVFYKEVLPGCNLTSALLQVQWTSSKGITYEPDRNAKSLRMVNTQYSVEMMCCGIMYLKPIQFCYPVSPQ